MTAKNDLTPFLVLLVLASIASLVALASRELFALGFILTFACLPGWASYFGMRKGSIRRPGGPVVSERNEEPAEKASCATQKSA